MSDNIKFGLPIPQGWSGGDLPLEEENTSIEKDNIKFGSAIPQ